MSSSGTDSSSSDSDMVLNFTPEKILAKRVVSGETEYLIKWENYGEEDNSWEHEAYLRKFRAMIDKYEESLKVPRRIVGTTNTDKDERAFIMEWEGPIPVTNIPLEEANRKYPQTVIKYYESRYNWRTTQRP